MTKVEVAAVCTMSQPPEYWTAVAGRLLQEQKGGLEITRIHAVRSAMPDAGKSRVIGVAAGEIQKNRDNRTDANRNAVMGVTSDGRYDPDGFMAGKADWLFFMDDDTVMPRMAISRLIGLGRDFVAGLYYTGGKKPIPLMYRQDENGLYHSIDKYPKGALIPVDAVGMGCTLIHRSVIEKIVEGHTVVQRPNGSLFPVPNSIIDGEIPEVNEFAAGMVVDGVYHMPVQKPTGNTRPWPLYGMEYGRTEDLHFCELARNVGITPYVDTTIVCDHLKLGPINEEKYKAYRMEALRGIENS